MTALKKIRGGIDVLNKVNNLLLGIDIVVMFIVLMVQVFSRFIIFVPLAWSQDMITFLLVVSCFLGAGSATAYGKQIRLEFFVDLLPTRVKDIVLILADLISVIFLAVIIQQCFELGMDNIGLFVGASVVPFGVYYFAVLYGSAVMILNFLCIIADHIKEFLGKNKEVQA